MNDKSDQTSSYHERQTSPSRNGRESEQLCLATLKDRLAVVNIDHNIYNGFDYLPARYTDLVQGPGISGYLYRLDNEVVAFASVAVIDGGETLTVEAGRVMEGHRGKGLYGRFYRRILDQYTGGSWDIRHLVSTVTDVNMAENGVKLLKSWRIILKKFITRMETNAADINKNRNFPAHRRNSVELFSHDEVANVLNLGPVLCGHLFPENRIMVRCLSFRIMPENLSSICKGGIFVATYSDSVNTFPKQHRIPSVLSCGTNYPCQQGLYYCVDVFGAGSRDELLAHVQWHLLRMVEIAEKGRCIMDVIYTRKIDDVMDGIKGDYAVSDSDISDIPERQFFVLEKEFIW